jgi:CHAT domain-containing protein
LATYPDIGNVLVQSLCNSGLYLAGAENSIQAVDRNKLANDDGILTAYEISNMTLPNLDLAIISSCESGLGKVTNDGIYGLQRAFRIAGAKNILISLWKIDDNASQLFVRKFTEYYLKGKSSRVALKTAQNFFRTNTIYKHPYYWGGFMVVGADIPENTNFISKRTLMLIGMGLLFFTGLLVFLIKRRKITDI